MAERLVDVLRDDKAVLRTLPVAREGASEEEYKTKALEIVAHAKLVPDADPENLTARMHVSRVDRPFRMGMIDTSWLEPSRAWRKSFASVLTFCGNRTAIRTGERKNTGIAL
jgi:hypothetical protein